MSPDASWKHGERVIAGGSGRQAHRSLRTHRAGRRDPLAVGGSEDETPSPRLVALCAGAGGGRHADDLAVMSLGNFREWFGDVLPSSGE